MKKKIIITQETVFEKAAEKYLENINTKVHKDLERDEWMKIGFIAGAKWQQKNNKDIEAYKNRIRVLQNLNTKYCQKLGISNESIDALGLISPLDNIF